MVADRQIGHRAADFRGLTRALVPENAREQRGKDYVHSGQRVVAYSGSPGSDSYLARCRGFRIDVFADFEPAAISVLGQAAELVRRHASRRAWNCE